MPTNRGKKGSKDSNSTAKDSNGDKKSSTSGGSRRTKPTPRALAPSTDPIIITGGSLFLEYADGGTDGFADNGSGSGKKKLKHKRNNSGGKAELTTVEFKDTASGIVVMTVNVKALGINGHCQIMVNYDYQ